MVGKATLSENIDRQDGVVYRVRCEKVGTENRMRERQKVRERERERLSEVRMLLSILSKSRTSEENPLRSKMF